jgi:hypothetical protein
MESRGVPLAALFAITGVLWCARSLAAFTDPAFTDPETAWDWFAVVSFSAALAALAFALPLFARLVRSRIPMGIALVAAAGAGIGAVGNLLEDGLQLDWAGDWLYLPSVVLMTLGLAALTVAVAVCGHRTTRLLAGPRGRWSECSSSSAEAASSCWLSGWPLQPSPSGSIPALVADGSPSSRSDHEEFRR